MTYVVNSLVPELRKLPHLRRLEYLKLWTLDERRACADLIEVYKIIHGISSVSFDTFFEFNSYGTTRGHSLKLMQKRASTNSRHHFFSERVINNWNNLDNSDVWINQHLQRESGKTQTVKRDRSVCWQLMLLDLLSLSRAVGEASSGKLFGLG